MTFLKFKPWFKNNIYPDVEYTMQIWIEITTGDNPINGVKKFRLERYSSVFSNFWLASRLFEIYL